MKRALFVLPVLAASFVFAAQATSPLTPWTEKVAGLKSLKADISVQEVGQSTTSFKLSMQKPASLRVESAQELVVADGTTVSVYDKAGNYFYTKPQTDGELKSALTPDQYTLFRAFFDKGAFNGVMARAGQSRTVGGETVKPIDIAFDKGGKKTMTIYVGADGISRKAERNLNTQDGKKTAVLTAKNVQIDGTLPADEFQFKAPESAEQVKYEDLIANKWFTDLDEAVKVAKAGHKKIFVDFFATWCGPCKMLEAEVFSTPEFKALSKEFVFLRVDVDAQPSVAASFNIEAMPTQAVLKSDGVEMGRTVGYGGKEMFFDFINQYVGK